MKAILITAVLSITATASAQTSLKLPATSPAASVTQTIGITEVTVNYHRPAVNGRPIWGQLVPYGETWRAGANENTTVAFSTDVKVGGKPLKAGTYGLHTLPTDKDWTVMLSTTATAWGSFTYDPKDDALRITVTPRPLATSEERLSYRFDAPSNTKATLVLAWEKLALPIEIEVDTPKIVMDGVRSQLSSGGLPWQPYSQAANYWLKNGGPLDEAMKFADHSIATAPAYQNLRVRAAIFEKQGNAKAAAADRAKAEKLATETDLNQTAYGLMNDHKPDAAIALFRTITVRYPESANAQGSLGEALAAKGDKAGAQAAYTKALALAKDPVAKKQIEQALAKLKSS
jgi:predicted negative regulator of RcsB-dependent stress response